MLELADVLRTILRGDEYHGVAEAALSLYELKGNVIGAARAQSRLGNPVRET
jgi:hypothetical protein